MKLKVTLLLSLFVTGIVFVIFFLPKDISNVVWYGSFSILPLAFGLVYPYFKYFTGNKYLKVNTEINSVDSYVNNDKETVYIYYSTYKIEDKLYELKFELNYLRKVGNKLEVFVRKSDNNQARLAEDIYDSMVTSFVVGIIMIPLMIYAIYCWKK